MVQRPDLLRRAPPPSHMPGVKGCEPEQIVAAMKERGIDHESMLFEDEGHGFAKPENRLRFYEAADRFLAKHMLDA